SWQWSARPPVSALRGGPGEPGRGAGPGSPPWRARAGPARKAAAAGPCRTIRWRRGLRSSAIFASRLLVAARTGPASLLQSERPEQVASSRPVAGRLEEFVKPPARLGQQVPGLVEQRRAL